MWRGKLASRLSSEHTFHGAGLAPGGPGPVQVPADQVTGLFEPFRRLSGRAGSPLGTGLGLSIVASVARALIERATPQR